VVAASAGDRCQAWSVDPEPNPAADPSCETSPELTEFLLSLGATPERIAEATSQLNLIGLSADLVLSAGDDLTAADVADQVGAPVEQVVRIWTALGVEVLGPDVAMFTAADVNLVETLVSTDLFTVEEGDEFLHVVGTALSRIAEAAVSSYVRGFEARLSAGGADPLRLAQKGALGASTARELGSGLGAVFIHLMRDGVVRQRLAQAQVSDRALFRLAVGFVDLVGFTPLSHRMGTRELSDFIGQFEDRAFRLAVELGGRIVKHIGDEVMFVAIDPVAACRLALALMAEFMGEGIQPRGGLAYGDVVARQGDYYGEVVNLASRLADLAIPGEVLADDNVRQAAAKGPLVFEGAGRRQLKGFDEPVGVYSVLAADSPRVTAP
jgi:adenylate cyclase